MERKVRKMILEAVPAGVKAELTQKSAHEIYRTWTKRFLNLGVASYVTAGMKLFSIKQHEAEQI
jgi:hypothetical protein